MSDKLDNLKQKRHLGLWDSTMIGISAIVGGGIFALAGVAFKMAGPGAILAFALNGLLAFLVVFSFAEMSAAFPQSGGPYIFAKKILSVQSAFVIGWIVWFASIMAAVLYALGFASYAIAAIERLWYMFFGYIPAWCQASMIPVALALCAVFYYTLGLLGKNGGRMHWENLGKIFVFGILIAGGLRSLFQQELTVSVNALTPFFQHGTMGILMAMGYTFIALQGFDLIPAVAGEIRSPEETVPRAMKLSLALALGIYLPLLFIISTVGVKPDASLLNANSEMFFALAVQNYLGEIGFWLVILAATLSMLSALKANLFAASRVAYSMACDRTLPQLLRYTDNRSGIPSMAIITSTVSIIIFLFAIPNVEAAGAAASLIFLISFASVQIMSILARKRSDKDRLPYKTPWFPFIPIVGSCACIALALFQGIEVPSAGLGVFVWLGIGAVLFLFLFAHRALVFDASAEAQDPFLTHTRGRNPLVLAPIANPDSAEAMVTVANAIAPPDIGRVLLLSVVSTKKSWIPQEIPQQLIDAQKVLEESLMTSNSIGLCPEALITLSKRPWDEIGRVARIHRCESLLLGFSRVTEKLMEKNLEELISQVDCNVIILRAPRGWQIKETKKILVPVGGRRSHEALRARLLSSFHRMNQPEVSFLRVVPEDTPETKYRKMYKRLQRFAEDESPGTLKTVITRSNNVLESIITCSQESDLTILGLQNLGPHKKTFGNLVLEIAQKYTGPLIMISKGK